MTTKKPNAVVSWRKNMNKNVKALMTSALALNDNDTFAARICLMNAAAKVHEKEVKKDGKTNSNA